MLENITLDVLLWGGPGGLPLDKGIENIAPDKMVRLGLKETQGTSSLGGQLYGAICQGMN